jgi:hypothetical protein
MLDPRTVLFALVAVTFSCGGSAFVTSDTGGGGGASGGSTGGGGSGGAAGAVSIGGAGGSAGTAGVAGTATSGGAAGTSGSGGVGGGAGAGGAIVDATVPDMFACTGPGQCTLMANRCCAPCEPAALSQYVGVNNKSVAAYKASLDCGMIACAPCLAPSEPSQINTPQFAAICQANKCTAVDVRTTALSRCTTNAECHLRWGTGCCEGCSGVTGGLVAISAPAELRAVMCSEITVACLPCVPTYPANVTARCMPATSGIIQHCGVVYGVGDAAADR